MNGTTHQLVANLALACLETKERHLLFPRWGGIESGATLSDEFRIMWEPEESGSKNKQLVHRCFIDSDDPKDHGCVTRAWDHASGCVSFIRDYLKGELSDAYTEDEFLENLGMFLGITCHHIADLCTPVHVGHKMDYPRAGSKSRSHFHAKVERDIARFSRHASLQLHKPQKIPLSKELFMDIAKETYTHLFLNLGNDYATDNQEAKTGMTSQAISNAVKHTADVWHSILKESGMLDRDWSMQPLL
ncbi:MAG: hypothetical protein KAH23_09430 [Kiritimatiellae bacterium]|nr:hypothetical protein [Kiritimatiellia bacterium]